MKGFNILVVFLVLVSVCQGQELNEDIQKNTGNALEYISFGEKIDLFGGISTEGMTMRYRSLAVSDTLEIQFSGKITKVCQARGCWMKVKLTDSSEVMVRFKEYGFFMPKDSQGKLAVISGMAFVGDMSIEDQKHYAKDAGQAVSDIAKITAPVRTYGFEAKGVLLENQ